MHLLTIMLNPSFRDLRLSKYYLLHVVFFASKLCPAFSVKIFDLVVFWVKIIIYFEEKQLFLEFTDPGSRESTFFPKLLGHVSLYVFEKKRFLEFFAAADVGHLFSEFFFLPKNVFEVWVFFFLIFCEC